MERALTDIRLAIRRWRARPAFATVAIIILAIGIGATTAIFSVVDAVIVKRLPWRDADRLVTIWVVRPDWRANPVLTGSWDRGAISWPIFEDLRTKTQVFSEVGAWSTYSATLNRDRNEFVRGLRVSASFLPMLGVTPHLGRFFRPEEDGPGITAVVLTYEMWQRRFGGAPDILQRTISLQETLHPIVGVLPPAFDFEGTGTAEFLMAWGSVSAHERTVGNHFMYGVARLKPGVTLDAATADSAPLVRGTESPAQKQVRLAALADEQLGSSRQPLLILLGTAGLLLLMACSNVAALLLGDAGSRRHEIAVRAALGGLRGQIGRHLFVESLMLAAAAAVSGVVLAMWLTPGLVALAPSKLPRIDTVSVDLRAIAFACVAAIATALLFGLAPSLSLASVNPAATLRHGGRDGALHRHRAHRFVVATQMALAVLLLAIASLFGETLIRMTAEPLGFDPARLIAASVRLPPVAGQTPPQRALRNEALLARLAEEPGVAETAATSTAPFSGSQGSNSIEIPGRTFATNPSSNRHIVTERYFQTLGIPIVRGRGFESTDLPGAHVAVVNDAFERTYMDGQAVGKAFILNGDEHRIVGVIAAAKHREYTDTPTAAFYALQRQLPTWAVGTFLVRTRGSTEGALPAIRNAIMRLEPTASIVTIDTMDDMLQRSVGEERYRALLSLLFGGTALVLAVVGLYGLCARGVADRRREIGVRLALGASPPTVRWMVVRQAMLPVAAGLMIGVPIALATGRVINSLLYGVTLTAPHTFLIIGVVLLAIAVVAAAAPAIRASRIDPSAALRSM